MPPALNPHTSLILGHAEVFLWVNLLAKRSIAYMISLAELSFPAEMSHSMKQYSHFLLKPKTHKLITQTPQSYLCLYQMSHINPHSPILYTCRMHQLTQHQYLHHQIFQHYPTLSPTKSMTTSSPTLLLHLHQITPCRHHPSCNYHLLNPYTL